MHTLPVDVGSGPLAVRTESLRKSFSKEPALRGVDLRVPDGAVYVLMGQNGAGKSTLLKLLMNLLHPDSGTAEVFGFDSRRRGQEVRAQIGYAPELHNGEYPWMTVGRLLQHQAAYFASWDPDYLARLTKLFDLRLDRRFGVLSKGQAKRVQLVLALAHRPPLLLLDEPTDGLDPIVRDQTLALLAEHMADTPTTMLISTHRVYEVEKLADHVGFLQEGQLIGQYPRDELRRTLRRYRVQVPDGWSGAPRLDRFVVRRSGDGREVEWTVWGEETEVTSQFERTDVVVRDISSLSLDDAAIALLGQKAQS